MGGGGGGGGVGTRMQILHNMIQSGFVFAVTPSAIIFLSTSSKLVGGITYLVVKFFSKSKICMQIIYNELLTYLFKICIYLLFDIFYCD